MTFFSKSVQDHKAILFLISSNRKFVVIVQFCFLKDHDFSCPQASANVRRRRRTNKKENCSCCCSVAAII